MNVIGLSIAALGAALGLALIGYSAMQSMGRQPEAIGKLQVAMLIALAFVELVFLLTVFVGAPQLAQLENAGKVVAPVSTEAAK
ncbi:MAG: ATP synthase F0 subunit C [Fimbriimonas sp.]